MANIMSVDVEDWFHILELSSTPAIGDWDNLESRVERNLYRLLDEFDRADAKATCFFLGWVADRLPKMVIEACRRGHGGIRNAELSPHSIESDSGSITEFPLSAAVVFGRRICCFGGGYLRIFPRRFIRHMSRRVNAAGRPVIYYLHPREIDPGHPRLQMGWRRRFKSYVNLSSTMPKLRAILAEQDLTSFKGWMAEETTVQ